MKNIALFGLLVLFGQQTLAQQFVCPSTGLFPDPESPKCAHYYKCIVTGTQQLAKVRYKCSLNFVFHDTLKICVSPLVYRCPYVPVSTTTAAPTTTARPFVCPAGGDFPNDLSWDCKNYHFCIKGGDLSRPATCAGNSIFNWALRSCLPPGTFGCALQSGPFKCPAIGKFPDLNSPDGSGYFTCFVNWNGIIVHQTGTCPNGEVFNSAQGCKPRTYV